jgi:hypothetical protein
MATPAPPLGDILATLQLDDLKAPAYQADGLPIITKCRYLASYNWLYRAEPRIFVPGRKISITTTYLYDHELMHVYKGEPPAWTPPSKPPQLQEDSGQCYRDLNAARSPTYPLEPMIQAILTDKPGFNLANLDIIGCDSTMGNLLRFVREQGNPFRMLVEVVGNTVFLIRRENSPTEKLVGVHGYGHAFPEANTTWSKKVKGSMSHQRLIQYDFAGMKCLVRFEADGYLPDLAPDVAKDHIPEPDEANADEVLASVKEATISIIHLATTDDDPKKLHIERKGRHIPQAAVYDLKTRSIKKKDVDTLGEEMARLWIAQIPNFILAYHKFGKFEDVRVQDVSEKVKQWEKDQQPSLAKFANLLQMIVSFARSSEIGRFEIEREEGGKCLNLREQGGVVNSVLPSALTKEWDVEIDA